MRIKAHGPGDHRLQTWRFSLNQSIYSEFQQIFEKGQVVLKYLHAEVGETALWLGALAVQS